MGFAISIALLLRGDPFIAAFFYLLAWYSTLLFLEGCLGILGEQHTAPLGMYAASVPFWLVYEIANVRLHNWQYWDLPAPIALRWGGYVLAFATVLPAVIRMSRLIENLQAPIRTPPKALRLSTSTTGSAALLCLALPLLWPQWFFPLIWAPAFLLCEPLVARAAPSRSWLAAWQGGHRWPLISLLLAGLICGLLWESLNFWAGAKWKYTVPWPQGPKLFEMPWLGFAGFLPFALGCKSFWEALNLWWLRQKVPARTAIIIASVLFSVGAMYALDHHTVKSWSSIW
jgi:hypothetical protein